jgi:hypothetical protein
MNLSNVKLGHYKCPCDNHKGRGEQIYSKNGPVCYNQCISCEKFHHGKTFTCANCQTIENPITKAMFPELLEHIGRPERAFKRLLVMYDNPDNFGKAFFKQHTTEELIVVDTVLKILRGKNEMLYFEYGGRGCSCELCKLEKDSYDEKAPTKDCRFFRCKCGFKLNTVNPLLIGFSFPTCRNLNCEY